MVTVSSQAVTTSTMNPVRATLGTTAKGKSQGELGVSGGAVWAFKRSKLLGLVYHLNTHCLGSEDSVSNFEFDFTWGRIHVRYSAKTALAMHQKSDCDQVVLTL